MIRVEVETDVLVSEMLVEVVSGRRKVLFEVELGIAV